MIPRFLIHFHILCFSLLLLQCNGDPSESSIMMIQEDRSLDLQSAISKILPLVFPHLLKDWSLEENQATKKWILNVSYGGSTALTFNSQKEYMENTFRTQSLYNARLIAATAKLPIQAIRLSLTKPLYVKGENHPDVGIQEFEIYRTSLDVEKAKILLADLKNITPFSDFKKHQQELIRIFDQIQNISTVELNELNLITVE